MQATQEKRASLSGSANSRRNIYEQTQINSPKPGHGVHANAAVVVGLRYVLAGQFGASCHICKNGRGSVRSTTVGDNETTNTTTRKDIQITEQPQPNKHSHRCGCCQARPFRQTKTRCRARRPPSLNQNEHHCNKVRTRA